MSGDEIMVIVASAVLSMACMRRYYFPIANFRKIGFADREFRLLAIAPVVALIGIFLVIKLAASADVRDAPEYLLMYSLLGVAWFFGAAFVLEFLGISFRDDAEERRNPAAAIVVVYVLLAHAAIYAGANIGNGPGWWTVIVAGALGSGAWFALWFIADLICGVSEDITVDRDVPAAIRLGGYALAMGLICARGAAGDWTSFNQTVIEFAVAWPIIPLTMAVIGVELLMDARPEHYRRGVVPASVISAAYLALAIAAVQFAGPLPHNPQYDYLNTDAQ